jgi:anti-sigma factor RsiW
MVAPARERLAQKTLSPVERTRLERRLSELEARARNAIKVKEQRRALRALLDFVRENGLD